MALQTIDRLVTKALSQYKATVNAIPKIDCHRNVQPYKREAILLEATYMYGAWYSESDDFRATMGCFLSQIGFELVTELVWEDQIVGFYNPTEHRVVICHKGVQFGSSSTLTDIYNGTKVLLGVDDLINVNERNEATARLIEKIHTLYDEPVIELIGISYGGFTARRTFIYLHAKHPKLFAKIHSATVFNPLTIGDADIAVDFRREYNARFKIVRMVDDIVSYKTERVRNFCYVESYLSDPFIGITGQFISASSYITELLNVIYAHDTISFSVKQATLRNLMIELPDEKLHLSIDIYSDNAVISYYNEQGKTECIEQCTIDEDGDVFLTHISKRMRVVLN